MFRSEKMAFCQLILQNEASFNCMAELGEIGLLQFKDLNKKKSLFKKRYISEVKRCENLERIINYLEHELNKNSIEIPVDSTVYPAANHRVLSDYEGQLEGLQKEVRGIDERLEQLSKNFVGLIQLKHLLLKTDSFFEEVDKRYEDSPLLESVRMDVPSMNDTSTDLLIPLDTFHDDDDIITVTNAHHINSFKLKFIAGVILREKLEYFERMLFRVCHGNTLLKYADVEILMPSFLAGSQDSSMHKAVFLVFFQGEQLQVKVQKICESFHATIYPCPDNKSERRSMSMGVMTRLEDLNLVLNQTQDFLHSTLMNLSKHLHQWSVSILKTKQIYHQLNKLHFDKNLKTLFGKCWAPVRDLDKIHSALLHGASNSQSNESSVIFHQIVTRDSPPTYHKSNHVTQVSQDIINAYSVPSYLEVNPAIFSTITFPFLFSVMFGDSGHGVLLTLFGLLLVCYNFPDKLRKNEMFHMIYSGRYMIFMMGIFSIYSGLLYNDCFSLPLNLWGSNWSAKNISNHILQGQERMGLDPIRKDQLVGGANIFGMDPVWMLAGNKITWLNSFKMKISVIFGVCHMFFGVLLSFTNHRYFSHKLDIIAEFIPQVIFLLSTFGYLVLLVVFKWLAYDATQSTVAPSLLIGFINMFLMTYPSSPPSSAVSDFRHVLQVILLLTALLCVPWMLLLKPYVLYRRKKKSLFMRHSSSNRSRNHNKQEYQSLLSHDGNEDEEEDDGLIKYTEDDSDWANSTEYDFKESEEDDDEELERSSNNAVRNRNNNSRTFTDYTVSSNSIIASGPSAAFAVTAATAASAAANVKTRRSFKKEDEEFKFGEVMVTQAIHTIEYCLGCISHTASYLRLWALSLAHAQLSEVLWKMVLHYGFVTASGSMFGAVALFILFTPWALSTVVVLLVMEGLSAFLHTLRLHWIEFMSKFFKGEGHPFVPFSFRNVENTEEL